MLNKVDLSLSRSLSLILLLYNTPKSIHYIFLEWHVEILCVFLMQSTIPLWQKRKKSTLVELYSQFNFGILL